MKGGGLEVGEHQGQIDETPDRCCFQDSKRADHSDGTPCGFLTAVVVIDGVNQTNERKVS
jgi:hypothetical protein